uniref:Uncharacterized protein n=2 Tax=Oryza TaxID=4527 RepID=A0A0E0G858_ORYNI
MREQRRDDVRVAWEEGDLATEEMDDELFIRGEEVETWRHSLMYIPQNNQNKELSHNSSVLLPGKDHGGLIIPMVRRQPPLAVARTGMSATGSRCSAAAAAGGNQWNAIAVASTRRSSSSV